VDICTVLYHETNDGELAAGGCQVQWRLFAAVPKIDIDATF
jgi:hypothetical protein